MSKIINSKLVKSDKWYSKMFNNKYFKLVEDLNKKYYYFIFIILSIVIIFMCLLNIFISIELSINLDDYIIVHNHIKVDKNLIFACSLVNVNNINFSSKAKTRWFYNYKYFSNSKIKSEQRNSYFTR